ncbi:MAG: branched-chain amino acid transport system II carrier protein [Pseudomonadota bacterium]
MIKNKGQILILGFALFAMFFGAGNLIFPPFLGRFSNSSYFSSMIGFLMTGVGLPLLGIIAVAISRGGVEKMSERIHPIFGSVLAVIIVLIIGPLFAIPRTCATTFELSILPNLPWINSWIFSFIYFAVTLFFAINPSSAIDRIGKYLTPVILLTVLLLIVAGVIYPISTIDANSLPHPFGHGFLEGFQTMDLIGSTVMGMMILNQLIRKGYNNKSDQVKMLALAGVVSAICLAFVYGGLLYLGATTSSVAGEFTRPGLLVFITNSLLGPYGKIALSVLVSFACLTTAVALTVLNGEYLSKVSKGKLGYRWTCVGACVVSLIVSNLGVGKIVQFAVPPLVALYPMVIVIVFFSFINKYIKDNYIFRGAVFGAFVIGLIKAGKALGLEHDQINSWYEYIPLVDLELGWIATSLAGAFVGELLGRMKKIVSSQRIVTEEESGGGNLGGGGFNNNGETESYQRDDIPDVMPTGVYAYVQKRLGAIQQSHYTTKATNSGALIVHQNADYAEEENSEFISKYGDISSMGKDIFVQPSS